MLNAELKSIMCEYYTQQEPPLLKIFLFVVQVCIKISEQNDCYG